MRGEMFKRKLMTLKVCFEGGFFLQGSGGCHPKKCLGDFLSVILCLAGNLKSFFFE